MREDLISYLLGELDQDSRERIEQELASDPALQQEVERLRECLAVNEPASRTPEASTPPMPRGLADRTTQQIAACGHGTAAGEARDDYSAWACNFSMVDMTVALAMIVAIGSMLMPSLNVSRDASHRLGCQNNLRQLGVSMANYAQSHGGYMPLVSPQEHAGVFSIRLAATDVMTRDELSRLLMCRASALGERGESAGESIVIPTPEEFRRAKGERLLAIRRTSGGSYAYQIGYVVDGYYLPPRDHRHSLLPVLSDAPNVAAGRGEGANHGGQIINTLFQDGSVRALRNCVVTQHRDHLYLNDDGVPFAADSWTDSVASPSFAFPGVGTATIPLSVRAKFYEF